MYEHDVYFLRGYELVMLLVEVERKRSIDCNCDDDDSLLDSDGRDVNNDNVDCLTRVVTRK
jgi:hypothetical protein